MADDEKRRVQRIRVYGPSGPQGETEEYDIRFNCSRIEETTRNGMYNVMDYLTVLNYQDQPIAEFCRHNIVGVYYA